MLASYGYQLALIHLHQHNRPMPNHHPSETVTASDIASYVYCKEAWRLAEIGHIPSNQLARDAGQTHHARKATAERVAGGSIAIGRWLVIAALIALTACWAFK